MKTHDPDDYLDRCEVIVVNYNSGNCLTDCIDSVSQCGFRHITIIDNASVDNSLKSLCDGDPGHNIKIIKNNTNIGFAAACNQGILATRLDYLLFLNPDCTLDIEATTHLFAALSNDAKVGMAGGRLIGPDGQEQRGSRRDFPTPENVLSRALGLTVLYRLFPRLFSNFDLHTQALPDTPVPVDAVSGACMLVRRNAIDEVGLWDEGYFLHCEDLDWCKRFQNAAWKVIFVPQATVTHVGGACSRSRPIFVEWHKHKGMMRFYQKFYRDNYPRVLWPAISFAVWLRFSMLALYHLLGRLQKKMVLNA